MECKAALWQNIDIVRLDSPNGIQKNPHRHESPSDFELLGRRLSQIHRLGLQSRLCLRKRCVKRPKRRRQL